MSTEPTIFYYRVRQSRTHPERRVRKAWYGRTWQAELSDNTVWCPRAYTRWGIERKARRWDGYPIARRLRIGHRRQWWRAHVTQRNDDFYGGLRKAGKL